DSFLLYIKLAFNNSNKENLKVIIKRFFKCYSALNIVIKELILLILSYSL
ncbi:hypothetical protein B0J15DRAFT_410702, partial [Fusarium solani]